MSLPKWKMRAEGMVEALLVTPFGEMQSRSVDQLQLVVGEGIVGDRHSGTRLSDVRETVLKAIGVGTEVPVANVRQVSAIDVDELKRIGHEMQTPEPIPFGLCAENLVVSGLPRLTALPSGTLITFSRGKDGRVVSRKAVIAVWGANLPCRKPHDNLIEHFGGAEAWTPARAFASASQGRRGIVGFVYCSGRIKLGDTAAVWTPAPLEAAVTESEPVTSARAIPRGGPD